MRYAVQATQFMKVRLIKIRNFVNWLTSLVFDESYTKLERRLDLEKTKNYIQEQRIEELQDINKLIRSGE